MYSKCGTGQVLFDGDDAEPRPSVPGPGIVLTTTSNDDNANDNHTTNM